MKNLSLKTQYVLLNNASGATIPAREQFEIWIKTVRDHLQQDFEVSIEIVDKKTSQQLNKTYRNKDKPTNVLSFPLELPEVVEEILIGDLAICATIVEQEAQQQQKDKINHWAHMVIHGTLHLLGYDHIEEDDAQIMEDLERTLLAQLNSPDPYEN